MIDSRLRTWFEVISECTIAIGINLLLYAIVGTVFWASLRSLDNYREIELGHYLIGWRLDVEYGEGLGVRIPAEDLDVGRQKL
jgi:hypothetical protein